VFVEKHELSQVNMDKGVQDEMKRLAEHVLASQRKADLDDGSS
jgi:hypothetical protein